MRLRNSGSMKEGHVVGFTKFMIAASAVDAAVGGRTDPRLKGGIDFNIDRIKRIGTGFNIQYDIADFNTLINANIQGFVPLIIETVPLSGILPLLGKSSNLDSSVESKM